MRSAESDLCVCVCVCVCVKEGIDISIVEERPMTTSMEALATLKPFYSFRYMKTTVL